MSVASVGLEVAKLEATVATASGDAPVLSVDGGADATLVGNDLLIRNLALNGILHSRSVLTTL